MENEQLFELMTKMYSEIKDEFKVVKQEISGVKQEVSGVKQEVSGIKQEVSGVKQEVSGIKQEVLKTNMVIEHNIMSKIDLLFETNDLQSENIEQLRKEHGEKLDELLNTSMNHTARLKKIEQAVVEHDEILFKRVK
jgi:archaellum component FlaC